MRAKAAPARQRARERIAAERAAAKRAEARLRFLVAGGAITAVLAIVVALVTVKLTASPAHRTASESMAPATVVRQVTTVPAAALGQVSRRPGGHAAGKGQKTRAAADHQWQAGGRFRQRGILPVLRGRTLGPDRRPIAVRHLGCGATWLRWDWL